MAALGARSVGKRARAFVGAAVLLALAGVEVEAAKKGKVKRARGGAADAPDGTVETVRAADLRARAANATLALATFTVDAEYCGEECARFDALVARAARDVRIKDPSIWFARVVIDPTEPVPERLGALLGPQPGLPQLILFKAGEPLAWHADATRAAVRRADLDDDVDADSPALARAVGLPTSARAIEARMLAEASRPLVTPLRTAKQLERFLHLDAWAATHAADEPPRVVGFFPPSALGDGGGRPSARYDLFRAVAARLQSMLPFGECTDPSLQARMLGQPSSGATVQIVKASRTERKVPFAGPWTARALGRFIASHSGAATWPWPREGGCGWAGGATRRVRRAARGGQRVGRGDRPPVARARARRPPRLRLRLRPPSPPPASPSASTPSAASPAQASSCRTLARRRSSTQRLALAFPRFSC